MLSLASLKEIRLHFISKSNKISGLLVSICLIKSDCNISYPNKHIQWQANNDLVCYQQTITIKNYSMFSFLIKI